MRQSIFIFVFCFFSISSFAQLLANKDVTAYKFNLLIPADFYSDLQDVQTTIDNLSEYGFKDKITTQLIDSCYTYLVGKMDKELSISLLPADALQGKVLYNLYKYPSGTKKKALANSTTEYVMNAMIQVNPRVSTQSNLDLGGVYQKQRKKIKPSITVKIKLYDASGKRVAKVKAVSKSTEYIEISKELIFGLVDPNYQAGDADGTTSQTIMSLLRVTIDNAVVQLSDSK